MAQTGKLGTVDSQLANVQLAFAAADPSPPAVTTTRGWDDATQTTREQRVKEGEGDYRYFPEPDIPPFHPLEIAGKISLGESPQEKRNRFHEEYGLSYADAEILSADKKLANFTEAVMSELMEWLDSLPESRNKAENVPQKIVRLAGGWMTSKLMGILNEKGKTIEDISFTPENFAELISLIYTGRVNSTNAQKILLIMCGSETDKDPTHILEDKGWGQVSDENKLNEMIDEVIKCYPSQAEEYRAGKEPVLRFLMGMVMKATEGSADPQVVEKMLKEKLVK